MRTGLRRVVAAAVVAAVSALVPPVAPAGAQADDGDHALVLASQTAWVPSGGELTLRLLATTTAAREEVELAVAVHPIVRSRTAFEQTLDGTVRGTPLTVTTTLLSELTPDGGGALVVRLPVDDADPSTPVDRSKLQLRADRGGAAGVYPVRVELRRADGGGALATLTTHLVHANPSDSPRLAFAWLVPIHAPLALRPDTTRRLDPRAADAIGATVAAVAAHPDVPVTLRPTPETLDALALSTRAGDAATVSTLARLARDHQLVAEPYVPIDVGGLVGGPAAPEAARQVTRGGEVLRSVLDVRPDPRTRVLDAQPSSDTVRALRRQQVDRLVVPEAGLSPTDLPVTLAQPFELDTGEAATSTAVGADAGLSRHFDGSRDAVLSAHQFLADLAVLYTENPGRARGVVASAPRAWRPRPAFFEAVLPALAASPLVETLSLDELFAQVPSAEVGRGRPLVRHIETEPDDDPAPVLRQLRTATARVDAFADALSPGNRFGADLGDTVLAAQSTELSDDRRRAYVESILDTIDEQLSRLKMPRNRTVTLTARGGEIPITVLSELGYDVRARLRVDSDQLFFPEGQVRDVDLKRRNTTEVVLVRAQTSGAFPLRVTLESPDGQLVLASTRFTVRSTSASWVGVALSVGAALFLIVWWARHFARGRRNRRLVPA